MEELTRDELVELLWIYQQIKSDPTLILEYAGDGFRIETAYRAISRTMKDLQKKLDAQKEVH